MARPLHAGGCRPDARTIRALRGRRLARCGPSPPQRAAISRTVRELAVSSSSGVAPHDFRRRIASYIFSKINYSFPQPVRSKMAGERAQSGAAVNNQMVMTCNVRRRAQVRRARPLMACREDVRGYSHEPCLARPRSRLAERAVCVLDSVLLHNWLLHGTTTLTHRAGASSQTLTRDS